MTISRAADLWLGAIRKAARTEQTYRTLIDKLDAWYPHRDVGDVTTTDVRAFLDSQNRFRGGALKATATTNQNDSVICLFFDWLTFEGIIKNNPTRRNGQRIIIRRPSIAPEDNDNVVTVTSDDVRKLLTTAYDMVREDFTCWPEFLAISCLVYLGPRRRAIAQARIGDYNPVEGTLLFRTEKGSKPIAKPVPDELVTIINTAIRTGFVYSGENPYLVPSKGKPRKSERDDRAINGLVARVAVRAGVTTHVHALRAGFAVLYLEEKPGEIVGLSKLLGHKRIETTMTYLRKLNRRTAMESVRDLSWGVPQISAISEELMGANVVAEKEGFEPSFDANPPGEPDGSQQDGST